MVTMNLCGEILDRVLANVKNQGDNYMYVYSLAFFPFPLPPSIPFPPPSPSSFPSSAASCFPDALPFVSGSDFGDELKELQSSLDDYEDLISAISRSKKVFPDSTCFPPPPVPVL